MKKAVRAIIVHNNNLLVMKRNKFGSEYYTLIGGHVELGEDTLNALLREIHEETMVQVASPRLVYIESASPPYGDQYVYVCTYVSGKPTLHPQSDEIKINKIGNNTYTPMWLPITSLSEVPFRSNELQKRLIAHLATSFPEKIERFTSVIE